MKKTHRTMLSILLPLVLSINVLSAEDVVPEKIELLPEVKALIAQQETLPADFFENNLFIGLSGVFYPEDNFYEVASEVFQHNYPEYLKANKNPKLTAKDLTLIKLEDKRPAGKQLLRWTREIRQLYELELCSNYLLENCIAKTVNAKDKLQKLASNNRQLLQHYRSLALNSQKHQDQFLLMGSTAAVVGMYHGILKGYQGFSPFLLLTLNQAIFELLDQNYDEGLEDIRLAQSIVLTLFNEDKETSIVTMMIGIAYLQFVDQYMDALLTAGYLSDYLSDVRVEKLVAPYPDAFEVAIHHSLVFEQDSLIRLATGDGKTALSHEKINELYQLRNRYLDALSRGALKDEQGEMQKACDKFKNHCSLFGVSEDYLKRYFTQRNYHNMVYLKYLILRDNIDDKAIPAFLETQGEHAIDPITKEAFAWDEKTRAITLPLAAPKYLPAFVRSATMRNSRVKLLQVVIPQRETAH